MLSFMPAAEGVCIWMNYHTVPLTALSPLIVQLCLPPLLDDWVSLAKCAAGWSLGLLAVS